MLNNLAINSLWPHELYRPWNSPGQNTEVGSQSLLRGIFPTQGLNPGLPHCRQVLYQLSHQGNPGNQQSQIIWIQIPALNSVWPWESWWPPWSLVSLSIKCGWYSQFYAFQNHISNHIFVISPSSVDKESARNTGDPGLIPGSGRSAGKGIGYPF